MECKQPFDLSDAFSNRDALIEGVSPAKGVILVFNFQNEIQGNAAQLNSDIHKRCSSFSNGRPVVYLCEYV